MKIDYQRDNDLYRGLTGRRRGRPLLILMIFFTFGLIFFTGCQMSPESATPPAASTPTPRITNTPASSVSSSIETTPQPDEEQVISTPTLAPTATPSPLDFVVEDIVEGINIDALIVFGMRGEDLVNLLISVLIVLVGVLFGNILVRGAHWFVKRTRTPVDDRFLQAVGKQIKWLIPLIFLEFATARLAFISPMQKQWLDLFYFALFVLVLGSILWSLIDFGLEGPIQRAASPQNRDLLVTFTPLLRRTIQVVIILVGLAIILQNFGVNLSALLAILGLGGLAVSLAAKETLEDMISGFIILIDRPFQIGDRIKIETMDTWGDVEGIGARTTRIRTLDNRLVIVPNSTIGRNQVENYSYPDPSYRVDITLGIGYDSDIDHVIRVLETAVLRVPGILDTAQPIVRLQEFGDSAMIFQVLYWLRTYEDIQLQTQVNKSIFESLVEADIEMPFVTYDINLAYREPTPDMVGEHVG